MGLSHLHRLIHMTNGPDYNSYAMMDMKEHKK